MINVESLYRTYGPMVLRRCRRLLGDEHRALDALQDTFVAVLRFESRLTSEAPSSLLYRIATNVSLNKLRSEKRRPRGESSDDEGAALVDKIATCDDVESTSLARITLARIFGNEPDSTLAIAVYLYHDRMTLDEVAELVGMSVSGVRKRMRTLRERLELEEEVDHAA
jgi:RNA polymerase sigma-70 factor (ECF subfamily)